MKNITMKLTTGILLSILTLVLSVQTPTQAASLRKVMKNKEFSFACSGKYPPFNFINDKGELTGFDVEIAGEIAKRLGVDVKPVTTAWDGIIAGLLANRYDSILGSMAITNERLQVVNFSNPYYRSGAQLFVGKKSSADNINDLKGKKVGVTLGTTFETWLRTNVPDVEVVTYKGVPEMLLETANNRIDGFITDKLVGIIAINEKKAKIKLAGGLLYPELIGIAIKKDHPRLLSAVNKALADIQHDGTYEKISNKWFGTDIR